ncbi:hypothetical protein [Pedobacter sp. SL55]|uniref:hypothetical protein n=1 Tax=Pedobacter sp. SL55 TaxID=2995161 RepID=UPI0022702C74|nr:hypothetical protein [Pedobacter sp. SL55]WAC41749.1 hypothetical protein OVA16_05140 [Pedobacter sp. SL55]
MFSKLTLFAICCFVFSSCSLKKEKELAINFSTDSTAILFTGLDEVSLFRAKEQTDSLLNELVTISELNKDRATQEIAITGTMLLKNDTLAFIPNTPFVKGKTYLVQTLLNSSFGKTEDILKGDVGKTVKKQEKILLR